MKNRQLLRAAVAINAALVLWCSSHHNASGLVLAALSILGCSVGLVGTHFKGDRDV